EAKRAAKGLAGILSLGRTFDTSISSTAIRYVRDDIIPCTVIKWNHDGMGWRWFSPTTFNEAGFRKVIDDRKTLPSDSATELVFSGTAPDVSCFIRRGTTAALWFPFLSDESRRNALMIEEAISLGRFGVLTLLYPDSGAYDASW